MKFYQKFSLVFTLLAFFSDITFAQKIPSFHISISNIPTNGIIVSNISLAAENQSLQGFQGSELVPFLSDGTNNVDEQWVPAVDFKTSFKGTIIIFYTTKNTLAGTLNFIVQGPAKPNLVAQSSIANFIFSPNEQGVFPASISLKDNTGVNDYVWNDRLVDASGKQYFLRKNKVSNVELISAGNIASVMRCSAYYADDNGHSAPGNPMAVYVWYIFKNSPSIFIQAFQTAQQHQQWQENHFLEWLFSSNYFTAFAGDHVTQSVLLNSSKVVSNFNNWAASISNNLVLAALNSAAAVYDGYGGYGTYLLVQNPNAWAGWNGHSRINTAWLWIGQTPTPIITISNASDELQIQPEVNITSSNADAALQSMQKDIDAMPADKKRYAFWKLAIAKHSQSFITQNHLQNFQKLIKLLRLEI